MLSKCWRVGPQDIHQHDRVSVSRIFFSRKARLVSTGTALLQQTTTLHHLQTIASWQWLKSSSTKFTALGHASYKVLMTIHTTGLSAAKHQAASNIYSKDNMIPHYSGLKAASQGCWLSSGAIHGWRAASVSHQVGPIGSSDNVAVCVTTVTYSNRQL